MINFYDKLIEISNVQCCIMHESRETRLESRLSRPKVKFGLFRLVMRTMQPVDFINISFSAFRLGICKRFSFITQFLYHFYWIPIGNNALVRSEKARLTSIKHTFGLKSTHILVYFVFITILQRGGVSWRRDSLTLSLFNKTYWIYLGLLEICLHTYVSHKAEHLDIFKELYRANPT